MWESDMIEGGTLPPLLTIKKSKTAISREEKGADAQDEPSTGSASDYFLEDFLFFRPPPYNVVQSDDNGDGEKKQVAVMVLLTLP
ncbi:hypothetical protein NDU88_002229 [Pleurodeles waltl]|uniref:Uncharacterized protein n=1 Tax=Pleurodeles waltl TaxID=8319 RepID=A0AAV7P679_PLEWA|nr:hypothetical protein NDU88_002229 [Pleurodeles waltl]